jgi:hypothetical protein
MAADAVDVAHALAPDLAGDVRRDLARASEILSRWHLQHRIPVDRRIIMRRGALVWRRHRRQIELLAGLAAHLGRIHKAVAAHPHGVVRCWKVRDDVAALVVSHHDLGEFRGQLGRLRDDPHAAFGSGGAAHYPADVVIIDCNCRLLCAGRSRHGCGRRRDANCGNGRKQSLSDTHLVLPWEWLGSQARSLRMIHQLACESWSAAAHHPQPRFPHPRHRQGSRRGPAALRAHRFELLRAADPLGGTAADRKLMLMARSVAAKGWQFDSDLVH